MVNDGSNDEMIIRAASCSSKSLLAITHSLFDSVSNTNTQNDSKQFVCVGKQTYGSTALAQILATITFVNIDKKYLLPLL
jgi:hypothetical protein